MNAILISDYKDPQLSKENIQLLEDQNVTIEDWDIMIFLAIDSINEVPWAILNLIDNDQWFSNIKFMDQTWLLGVKYH